MRRKRLQGVTTGTVLALIFTAVVLASALWILFLLMGGRTIPSLK